LHIRTDE